MGVETFFFFFIIGTKPIVRRGAGTVRRYCPRCGDLRNFQEVTWQNYFSLFFFPLFPIGSAKSGYQCVSCGLPVAGDEETPGTPSHASGKFFPGESLVIQCPRCDGRMRVPLRDRGFQVSCPHCTWEFRVKGQTEPVPEARIDEQ